MIISTINRFQCTIDFFCQELQPFQLFVCVTFCLLHCKKRYCRPLSTSRLILKPLKPHFQQTLKHIHIYIFIAETIVKILKIYDENRLISLRSTLILYQIFLWFLSDVTKFTYYIVCIHILSRLRPCHQCVLDGKCQVRPILNVQTYYIPSSMLLQSRPIVDIKIDIDIPHFQ